jgi:hypothetical protein
MCRECKRVWKSLPLKEQEFHADLILSILMQAGADLLHLRLSPEQVAELGRVNEGLVGLQIYHDALNRYPYNGQPIEPSVLRNHKTRETGRAYDESTRPAGKGW